VQYNLLVAKDIAISPASSSQQQVNLGNNNNYVTLANNGPPTGTGAVLVQ
jgi:hypothetical protein